MALFVGMGIAVIIIGIVLIFTLEDSPDLKPSLTHKSFWRQVFSSFQFNEMFKDRELFWVLSTGSIFLAAGL